MVVERIARDDSRRLAKPRVGFAEFVAPLAALVAKFGDQLGGGLDVDAMRAAFTAYQDLESEWKAAVEHLASIESTRLVQSSAAWKEMLLIYTRARDVGRTNASVRGAIDPFEQFMKYGPRTPKKTTAPVTTP